MYRQTLASRKTLPLNPRSREANDERAAELNRGVLPEYKAMDDNSNNKSDEVSQTSGSVPLIEIGWIVAGGLDEIDRQAIETAREETLNYLREKLPLFLWRMPMLRRKEMVAAARVAPVDLLDAGVVERNAGHWDFTVVITTCI